MNGYIKLYRSLLDWQWWGESDTFKTWVYCLFRARWNDGKYKGVSIGRGEFVTTYRDLAKDLNLSERKTRTALSRLAETGEISVTSESKYTVIRVNKYDDFQAEGDTKSDTQSDTNSDIKTTQKRHAESMYFSTDSGICAKPFDTKTTQKATDKRHNSDTNRRIKENNNIIIHSPEDARRHLENIRQRLEEL